MPKTFQFKKGELRSWRHFYRDFPKAYQRAKINTVNNLAFQGRRIALDELDRNMIIRAPAFIKGSVRFQRATMNRPEAEFGSIRRDRFSGWEEQQTGRRTKRTRVQTLQARRRNWKNKVAPRVRLKPGAKFIRPADVRLNNNQIVPFLQILDRRKYRQPFFIPTRYKRLQRGLYIFVSRKIRRVQNLDPANVQPARDEWMSRAVGRLEGKVLDAYVEGLKFAYNKTSRRHRLR